MWAAGSAGARRRDTAQQATKSRQQETRAVPRRDKTRPARLARPRFRYKTRPAGPFSPHVRYKTRPARPKWPDLAGFARAWRTFYRFRHQQATHGELCTACEAETGLAITEQQAPLVWRAPEGPEGDGAWLRHPWETTTPPPAKSRMQFDWKKFQQCLKTLQFQRC